MHMHNSSQLLHMNMLCVFVANFSNIRKKNDMVIEYLEIIKTWKIVNV